jgi:creatinine amidohydrolase
MLHNSDYRRNVRYELMLGREATAAIARFPVGYLPVGCMERHGDHLPMGLDVIKAHGICCLLAQAIGGVVFPPHFYSGIHRMTPEQIRFATGDWGCIFTDATAEDHLVDIIGQLEIAGIRVLVLYTGHYPTVQSDMVERIAARFNRDGDIRVVPFWEGRLIPPGDHAGISETSFMLYLDRSLVNMSAIGEVNFRDHGWTQENSPRLASAAKGEAEVAAITEHLRGKIQALLTGARKRSRKTPRGKSAPKRKN